MKKLKSNSMNGNLLLLLMYYINYLILFIKVNGN